ncbi:DUF4350 domain-containing protein [Pedobacter sp. ASV28]|uniref:DUF4350 domain-containing protein n=1 Tax=Pedobacter sp. ASV28 TaxID=2795123 RepID=UPI0018EB6D43|nr:DUF4350 domain-containing protein [Pedobacter sp. ASV28]
MKGLRWYLIICGVLLTAYLVAQYTRPKPINWTPTYLSEDKIPYGTYILRKQIGDLFPNAVVRTAHTPIYNALKEEATAPSSNYLIIASRVKIDKADLAEMIKYMQAGNHIFIAAFELNGEINKRLKLEIGSDFEFQNRTKYPINFVNPLLKREMDFYFERGISAQYFSKIDTAKAIVLGRKYEQKANFVQYRFGKGSLFILPNPQLLTNYSLLNENGAEYAAKALSYLPQVQQLVVDEYYTHPPQKDQSILRVLFKYDQLRWAYYIALLSLVVFVLYEMKRRQRIIPITDPLKNSSVEFAQVVGRVYYQQRNNKDIVEKKINYFLAYLRTKYRLKTTVLNQEFMEALYKLSGVDQNLIAQLIGLIGMLGKEVKVSDHDLIELNKLIEQFYKKDQ